VGSFPGRRASEPRGTAPTVRRGGMRAPRLFIGIAALGIAGVLTSGPASAGRAGNLKAFCRTTVDLIQHVLTESTRPAEDASRREIEKFEKRLAELLDRAERSAPAEIANDVSFASELTRIDPRTAETDFFLQILEPIQGIKRFAADNCEFKKVTVTARDHEFQGLPKTIKVGTVVFELNNEGAEVHEMAFGRIKGDVSLETLFALPAEERLRLNRIEELGAGAIAAPGASDVALVSLRKPGRYSVACFVPVGTTTIEAPTEGPPHTDEGMFAEFKVKQR
jgi:uncharacterized cupredoxin-like copper-binding protein